MKKNIAVLFGGQSSEHEVSCMSAQTIIENINKDQYDIILIGITKDGKWLKTEKAEDISSGAWLKSKITAVISPDATQKGIIIIDHKKTELVPIDVVFPVLHGLKGEDGTIQGLLELACIPYVGCGVLSSSVSMDKLYTKLIVEPLHIRQAKYVSVCKQDLKNISSVFEKVEKELSYPVFVKPSNAGSSRGVSKAADREELEKSLYTAAEHDRNILVEEAITGREIECAILGGSAPRASGVGEILAAADFYDYDAKYNNAESKTVIAPKLPDGVEEKIRDYAVQIFKAVDGYGLSRVDFFVEDGTDEIVFNEINTLPGFTAISMYPVLWETKGIGKTQLIEKLIQLAFSRYQ